MKITVRLFASYREHIGKRSMDVTLDRNSTVGDLVSYINEKFPGFSSHPDHVVVAVNEEYVSHSQRLKDGDDAAFIPPVSGGATLPLRPLSESDGIEKHLRLHPLGPSPSMEWGNPKRGES